MADGAYADWLQRGRVHHWEGRPVDAMLCFQRAASLKADAADARYLLGDVQWQLGLVPAAVATWRDAARVAPGHLAAQLALAEASLALGDLAGADDAARAALALAHDDHAACVLAAVAAFASGRDAGALLAMPRALVAGAGRLEAPAPGGTLARALVQTPEAAGARETLIALVPYLADIALALLVPLARAAFGADAPPALRNAREGVVRAALDRPVTEAELDVLREVAMACARGGDESSASALATRYAHACVALLPPGAPLLWPHRTAGPAPRIAVLLPPASDDSRRAVGILERAASGIGDAEWVVVGDGPLPGSGALARAELRPRPPAFDAALAATLARADCDLLVDFAGIALPTGSFLALRPARAVLSAAVGAPPHRAPLADESAPGEATALAERLQSAAEHARRMPASRLSAAALADAFEASVRAHHEERYDDAAAGYRQILDEQPRHAPTLHLFAALLAKRDRADEARALLDRALDAAPDFVEARAAAARLARDRGDANAGLATVDAGLERQPRSGTLWRVRGELELAHHDAQAAEAAFVHALELAPTEAEAHYNLGVAMHKQRRPNDAARAYQRALAFDPEFADAHFNLAVLFQEGGQTDTAVAAYRAVLARDPRRVAAYKNLGETLLAAGRIDDFLANFGRFEAHCPDALPLAVQALEACQYAADQPALERYLEGLRRERFRARDAVELVDALEELLYLLLFFDVEPEMPYRFAQTYATTAEQVYGAPLPTPAMRRPGKLRIGYLSADLRNHVMGKMMWHALRHHDRGRFALHFYSLSPARDDWTERFGGIADRFDVVAGLSEQDAAARIAADDLDVLVDLCGHTRGAKPGILALKPARVQLTHVATAGSVGLHTVDFKLTDAFADVPANQETMIETLLPMQGCVYPYRRIEPAAAHPFHRAALGIAADAVVIGAFVTPMKLSRRCLGLWRDVLERVPRARLAFSPAHPALRPVFERITAAAGIARDRLLFLPQGRDDGENQARYALVDLVLDPMPFGGVNGVLEPLDAGVPVVTLLGRRHGERSAYSILANLGVTQTVAEGGREYVDIAARLATDPAFMREVRRAIQAGLASSPLVDMPAHTRHLEAAYLEALRRKAPDAIREAERG